MPTEQPIAPDIIERATAWMARLWADDASAEDQANCLRWRAEHPHHELAWTRLLGFEQKLHSVPAALAKHSLAEPDTPDSTDRRSTLRLLGLLLAAGGLSYGVRRTDAWQLATATHSTRTGEVREVLLPDGSGLVLASASAIDVQFDDLQRLVILQAGEVFITTAPSPRPFRVQTRQGVLQALGTRFSVRQCAESCQLAVLEGAVQARPDHGAGKRVDAGQGATVSRDKVQPTAAVTDRNVAWVKGLLMADGMRLDELVAELARYRPGVLRCAPEVAMLRVSGVLHLNNTDLALDNLAAALPVQVVRRTRYWVTVRAPA
ncbi:FecR domain-containing protein [Pseudomonas sp. Bout1]|uniref:FecR domain-containing protein n=1 Tax=Pseudomonas sp. Bout1 TaxID=3048600 RepID=UPI002AB4735C|nr:FecR domain-containing protein [Pseudomonas sp. Bout1]MDY7532675.1 FecR domain-containing protein [Pseudomonas sp. Bout1]MEB0189549.1 FecR domain-containing protein [Pseudomonas sp. Bout1]